MAIRALKRYLSNLYAGNGIWLPEIEPDTGKELAVIGSGPAGMMTAYELRVRGYAVTVFDSKNAPGGMLRWAIPEFRLPFLNEVREGKRHKIGKKVVVIGSGNVAVDSSQTAIRLGAEEVTLIALESEQELPAFSWALESAI